MDFTFSPEQNMLRDSLSRMLSQAYPPDRRQAPLRAGAARCGAVWQGLAEMGLLALPLPEAQGGLGGTPSDLVAIGEVFGQNLVAEPFVGSILLGGAALGQMRDGIVDGSELIALAHEERHGIGPVASLVTTLTRDGDELVLNGSKLLVLDGPKASTLVVSARHDGVLSLVRLDPATPGVTLQPYVTVDGRDAAHVRLDAVRISGDALLAEDAESSLAAVIERATLFLAAESVGAMTELLTLTSTYAAARKQFGVPIASFQAIAHRLADMKIAWIKAQSLLLHTAALADAGQVTWRDIALLKGLVGRTGRTLAESAVQIHGGIGMTDELSVGHYLKRILANDALLGGAEFHFRRAGANL